MSSLYTAVAGSRERNGVVIRHRIHTTGPDSAFPRALCGEGIRLRDDALAVDCPDCIQRALTEIALALPPLGYDRLGQKVALEVKTLSYGKEAIEQSA